MIDETDDFEDTFAHEEPEQDEKKEEEAKAPETPATEQKPSEEPEPEPAKEPDPDPEVVEDPQTPEPSAKEPISQEQFKGYTTERDKRHDAEDRVKTLQAQLDALNVNREQSTELPKRPDSYDDPDGARAWDDSKHAADLLDMKLNTSEIMAEQQFGADKVKEAQSSFALLPRHEQQRILATQHPYREMITSRENEGLLDQISKAGGLDKLIEQKLTELNGKDAEISETIAAAKETPPPSLAKGGHAQKGPVEETEEEEFEDVFAK